MKHKLLLLGGVWGVLLLSASDRLAAEGPKFTLDVETQGKKVTLTVPPSRQVEFSLVQSKVPTPPAAIDFHLSPFTGEQGNTVAVKLVIPELGESRQTQHTGIKLDRSVLRLRLVEVNLPTAGKYVGSLIVTPIGAESTFWQIELSRAANYQPAVLVLDRQSLTADVTQPFWGWSSGKHPEFTVRVRDKTGQWDLNGVTARLEQVTKAPGEGFDLARNVDFKFNGQNADLTAASAKPMGRTVAAGQQATIGVVFQDLEAGEYNGTLRFTAVNSTAEDAQKLAFVLRVSHSIWWAVLVLLLALSVSFVTTKVITLLRNRYALLKKINDVDREWLRTEPPVLPVVWVRLILLQSKELASRFWLTGLEVIEDRVNKAAAVVELLDGVRQLRDGVEMLPELVRVRARAVLEGTICGLDPQTLDDKKATEFKIKLAELGGWLDEGKLETLYWADLSRAIEHLLVNVRIPDISDKEHQAVLEELVARLREALKDAPPDLLRKMEAERDYARLKILWGRRRDPLAFEELVKLQRSDRPLEDFFARADELAWERLKEVWKEPKSVEIRAPAAQGVEPLQAFRPLIFEFTTGDPGLDDTYLIKRGLKYAWTFQRGEVKSTPKSAGPNVVEYAQGKGTLKVRVDIPRREDETKGIDLEPALPIEESKDFDWKKGLERVEVISFVLAAALAIITGLSTLYFKNPSFGSVQDYITLFLWGAAVDQTKNALQLLQSYSATPGK